MKLLLFLLLPLFGISQESKIFVLANKGNHRIFVDSQGSKTYLNVLEFLRDEKHNISVRAYEVLRLEPDSCCITYILKGGQYCIFNHSKNEGIICENRDTLTCFKFSK